jgi:hypothetical protein
LRRAYIDTHPPLIPSPQVIEKSGSTIEEEMKEIKHEIWEDYHTIAASFDFYAACSGGNGFVVKLNAYADFLGDCCIPDGNTGAKELDTLFIITNLEDGLDKQESKQNDDKVTNSTTHTMHSHYARLCVLHGAHH